jgi:hypothetical protein
MNNQPAPLSSTTTKTPMDSIMSLPQLPTLVNISLTTQKLRVLKDTMGLSHTLVPTTSNQTQLMFTTMMKRVTLTIKLKVH